MPEGYRLKDLVKARIVSNKTQLYRLQKENGFPRPVKMGTRVAWYPKEEVDAWIEARKAERDARP